MPADIMFRDVNFCLLDIFVDFQLIFDEQQKDQQLQQLLPEGDTSLKFVKIDLEIVCDQEIVCDSSSYRLHLFVTKSMWRYFSVYYIIYYILAPIRPITNRFA